ncbi:MAG TPA: hypothetical protein VNK43_12585 [Gemmatimonadales bacterium]|nr:hypothetical protein [Gemmatimonadales bacterium]
MWELGAVVDPSVRWAKLLVSGVALAGSRGRILRIGGCRLRITGDARPCERMGGAHAGLLAAMRAPWPGGAFANLVVGGSIATGAPVDRLGPLGFPA